MAGRYHLTCLALCLTLVTAHIPMGYYDSAEPNSPIFVTKSSSPILTRTQSRDRLDAVRRVLSNERIDAFIVPTADAHNSQYIAPADARRVWLSGLRGSSGTAVVTQDKALVWTDARYFTQFEVEVDSTLWTLMRQNTDQSIQNWLATNLPANSVVGVDPTTYTRTAWRTLETTLNNANITLRAVPDNPVDAARRNLNDGPPARPNNPLLALGVNYTGRRSSDKLAAIISQIQSRGAVALVLTALDDIAYTLNLRGSDIPYNPVFFSYLVIRVDIAAPNILLFWDNGILSPEVSQHLASEGVQVQSRPYSQIFEYLRNLTAEVPHGSTIWLSEDASQAVNMAVESNDAIRVLATVSPVALMKVMKNDVELEGFRNVHVKDGVAVVRALHWVHQQVALGANVTEVNMSDKLEEFRGQEKDFMGPSFSTIAGAGENGAIIHYSPLREGPQRVIRKEDMLLVDSGGQYLDGTTDITRTRHMSTPTPAQRRAFTRVLKGQISLATAVFPAGTMGHTIEVLARKSLWDVGLNYGHGTGHGVGHFLNVHEGPAWILSSQAANDPGIRPKMVYSNEPGYYEVNEYGIRHEDLVETIEVTTSADHLQASGMVGNFDGRGAVGFYTISLAPHQTSCLDVNLLNDFELSYINSYHARVFSTLGPILRQRGLTDVLAWLEDECAPIQRSAAVWITATPLLLIVSVVTVFKA
ncbi:xaa-Pro aminopeptidase ApepP [Manduca sexta]|uniref:xaa-Pro aminopeptidase ApepP n=1 Tax=Manduca sexta TaxID=7130 RepID=UPI00188FF8E7|nr:xaa-Pro aminopeptidase ApepP [Manduca sexta]